MGVPGQESNQSRGEIYATATARQILNPLNEARDRTRNLTVPGRIPFRCTMMGTPVTDFENKLMVNKEDRRGGGMDWRFQTGICTLK